MTVSAKEVQELRKMSGAGMMECKSALSEANGNLDDAFKLLREKGIAKAEKKSSRDANEGLVAIKKEGNSAAMIEVNSETDFVSRNSEFHELVYSILEIVMQNKNDTDKSRRCLRQGGQRVKTALVYLNDDELLEVTPKSLRLRKRYLSAIERKRNKKLA